AGLAGEARGDDDHVGVGGVGVVEGAGDLRFELLYRAAAGQVEGLALWYVQLGLVLVGNVHKDDIAELLHGDGAGALTADVAGADDADLGATQCHKSGPFALDSGRGRYRRRGERVASGPKPGRARRFRRL